MATSILFGIQSSKLFAAVCWLSLFPPLFRFCLYVSLSASPPQWYLTVCQSVWKFKIAFLCSYYYLCCQNSQALYRICCGLSWCPARCRQDESPGGTRSCSTAASASESPSDGWGPPGSGTASPQTLGALAVVHVPPLSIRSPNCSPPPRQGWE